MTKNRHWTTGDSRALYFRLAYDFVAQIEQLIDEKKISQKELAARIGVSEGRVSQILSNPGNLTLKSMIQWSKSLGQKVAVVVYDDGDHEGEFGPINSEIFKACWEECGAPRDFYELTQAVHEVSSNQTRKEGKLARVLPFREYRLPPTEKRTWDVPPNDVCPSQVVNA